MENEKNKYKNSDFTECPQNVFYNALLPIREDNLFIAINRCGSIIQTPPNFFVKRDDTYKYNNLHFVTNGRGTLSTMDKTYKLEPGNIFILGAHQPHSYQCDTQNPLSLLWIEYAGGDSQRLTHRIASLTNHVFSPKDFLPLIYESVDIINNPSGKEEDVSLALYQLLLKIYKNYEYIPKKKNDIYEKMINYIEEHLSEELSLTKISADFGYNPTYFSGLFRQVSGMSYQKYVVHRRINQGCTLLTITDLSVEQISNSLGFYDTSHFINRFKHITGMSPTAYRKANFFV